MSDASISRATGSRLLSIGEFSRYAGISVRMLRHYDERGLLTPASVDPFTAYRRYTPDQLRVAGRIRTLRDAGCGIALIAELLPLFAAPEALRERLARHAASLEAAVAELEAQRRLALSLADALDAPWAEVGERIFPAVRTLWLRRTVACYPAEGELWDDLRDLLAHPDGVDPARFGDLVGATYFDEEFRDDDVEMAIWRDYDGPFTARDGFEIVELPEQRVAWTTHRGDFDTISNATETLGAWIAERGLTRTGAPFNVYVVGPGREHDPAKWITEVNVPIA
ncbi:MerR family transcriptional regulator [Microbacterium trichothecenolyticum]|uniref:DNA-binding transcriptional MerR regulator/effector-binding domain-containing protein n=1 Tax=Microbacterium trichothecenolyticum TaxID=69370 RepID=A0ABU0TYJ3_MICTR|nr:MerR family transcriptional regulator [Microbacterium trichothecenolyticum]MDQ1124721.1 DNA-binding transcriptional MerR regulator/effector-binding domain-containing protein [Microbacterium trichothecenolyticum]